MAKNADSSTQVVPWNEELAKFAAAAADVERPSVSTISFRNGVMKYMETVIPGNTLNVVVLAAVFENAYYEGRFDPNNPQSPVCFGLSETEDEMEPHENAQKQQNDSCAGCPKLEWGSAGEGRKGKACKQIRRLAVLSATDLDDPGKVAKAELAVCKLPVTSVKNWSNYVNSLATTVKRPPFAMITTIKVEPDPKNQFKVKFSPATALNEEIGRAVYLRRQEALNILLTPYADEEPAEAPKSTKM